MTRDEVFELVGECVAALNEERDTKDQIGLAEDTPLLAPGSSMSSLDVVSLSVDIEDRLRRKTMRDLDISPAALETDEHPLRTVGSLVDFLTKKLEDDG